MSNFWPIALDDMFGAATLMNILFNDGSTS
jgi:hypothetical protein